MSTSTYENDNKLNNTGNFWNAQNDNQSLKSTKLLA